MLISNTISVGEGDIKAVLKSSPVRLTVNKDIINAEIKRLQSEIGKYNNKCDDNNIKILVNYLTKVKRTADRDTSELVLHWCTANDGTLMSVPVNLISEPTYKVDANSFIELKPNQQLIRVDISDMAEIIAFDMINRDLDESHDSIEEMLASCSIVSPNSSKILTNRFKEKNERMYENSQFMRIGDSTYLNKGDCVMYNYFISQSYAFNSKNSTYKEPVKNSCLLAAGVYASQLLHNISKYKVECSLTEITPTSISILVNVENNRIFDFKEMAYEPIVLSAFGRKFDIEPGIMVY